MKVSFWLLLIPWNNFSSFSSSSTFLLARPLVELLQESIEEAEDRQCCVRLMEVLLFFSFFLSLFCHVVQIIYLRFALPLLFLCALLFLDCGGGGAASFTASSQKPMLELWASPQMLLESEPQLVQGLVFTDPHTELLRDVCKREDKFVQCILRGKTDFCSPSSKYAT